MPIKPTKTFTGSIAARRLLSIRARVLRANGKRAILRPLVEAMNLHARGHGIDGDQGGSGRIRAELIS